MAQTQVEAVNELLTEWRRVVEDSKRSLKSLEMSVQNMRAQIRVYNQLIKQAEEKLKD